MPRRSVAKRAALAFATLVLALTGCRGEESGSSRNGPTSDEHGAAPWGLADVALPNEKARVQALLEALPSALAGHPRARPPEVGSGYIDAIYGSGGSRAILVRAVAMAALEATRERARLTPLDHLRVLRRGEANVEAARLDPDAPVAYVIGSTTETAGAESRVLYTATWAEPDGKWIFVALGDSPALRAAAVEAFVAAAKSR